LRREFGMLDLVAPLFMDSSIAYRTENQLAIEDPGAGGLTVGMWQITQVPAGGWALVPTTSVPEFRRYFGKIDGALVRSLPNGLLVHLTGRHHFKLGLQAGNVTGRVAYLRRVAGGRYLVIFRQHWPQPHLSYCDVPLMDDGLDDGDAVQIYNDDGGLGGFAEIETHSPAIEVGRGPQAIFDSNITVVGLVGSGAIADWVRSWLDRPMPTIDDEPVEH